MSVSRLLYNHVILSLNLLHVVVIFSCTQVVTGGEHIRRRSIEEGFVTGEEI